MKKYIMLMTIAALVSFMLMGCAQDSTTPEDTEDPPATENSELTVAAAASLTDAMEEIQEIYKEAQPETDLTLTFGGSGALQAQIEEGAPVDVFLSAAQKQMDELEEKDMIQVDTRRDFLLNKVVLITPQEPSDITSFEDAATEKVDKIALGEPESVPVGQYAQEIFTSLEIHDAVAAKAVYGSDVRQVLSWVETGEVDCGVVYATDAAISDTITVITEAPQDSHKPVIYPAALIKDANNTEAGKAFLEFLSTQAVKEVFEKYGFTVI